MNTELRKFHADDRKAISEHVRNVTRMKGGFRVEVKEAMLDLDTVGFNPGMAIPMILHDDQSLDFDGYVKLSEATFPKVGEWWFDMCIAIRRWDGDYEPRDWFRAYVKDGRLSKIGK